MSRAEKKKAWIYASVIVLLLVALLACVLWFSYPESRLSEMLQTTEALRADVPASEDRDRVEVICDWDPATRKLTGRETLTLENRTSQEQDTLVLRSFSSAYLSSATSPAATDELFDSCYPDGFSVGGLEVDALRINGKTADWSVTDDAGTVLELALDDLWQQGETLKVELDFTCVVPKCACRFGYSDGIAALGNVFVVPAIWEDGDWRRDASTLIGDPFYTECMDWQVELTAPDTCVAAASSYDASPRKSNGDATWTWCANALRDFAMVISEKYKTASGTKNGVLLLSYALNENQAQKLLQSGAAALKLYESLWGSYPYATLSLASVDFPFGGMEYPRLVMIGDDLTGTELLRAVGHEVAHEWWYGLVGSDPVNEPWQDETLAVYAMLRLMEETEGTAARSSWEEEHIESAQRLTSWGSLTPGSPITAFANMSSYSQIVYEKGTAFWLALEKLMGQDRLDAALKTYKESYAYKIASRAQLLEVLSDAAGMNLTPLAEDYLDTVY